MQIPTIGHTQFATLGGLLAGPQTLGGLCERIQWSKLRKTLIEICGRLHRSGLIDKSDELLRGGERRRVYLITEDGRRAWRESADFYLTMIERFRDAEHKAEPPGVVLCRKTVKPSKPAGSERLPTAGELEQLLKHADPSFARAYRVLWTLNTSGGRLTGQELCDLTIADADLGRGTLKVRNQPVALDADCRRAVKEAIGDRQRGLLFVRASGVAFSVSTMPQNFRTAAKAAGLDVAVVKFLSRKHAWKHRKNIKQGILR